MSEIQSPLGKKVFNSTAKKTLVVSDEGVDLGEYPEIPKELSSVISKGKPSSKLPEGAVELTPEQFNAYQEQKKKILSAQTKLSNSAKERINVLLGLGRKKKDVKVGDIVFSLRTLSDSENEKAITGSIGDDKNYIWELRTRTLAYAIEKIDNVPLNIVLGTSNIDEIVDILKDFSEVVKTHLYEEYASLIKEVKSDLFSIEELQEEIKK